MNETRGFTEISAEFRAVTDKDERVGGQVMTFMYAGLGLSTAGCALAEVAPVPALTVVALGSASLGWSLWLVTVVRGRLERARSALLAEMSS